ncbi:hypothetical protein EVAR_78461_1 [Eumeta japonica]|uniref:Uncharacterized protein n=1 Tax=Eumeta variegata TaxID=151549 RepID=A0A4C1TY46_EUMVA|nr:hypothetical protein EVAR_78461_1 [Eumeta japonica]
MAKVKSITAVPVGVGDFRPILSRATRAFLNYDGPLQLPRSSSERQSLAATSAAKTASATTKRSIVREFPESRLRVRRPAQAIADDSGFAGPPLRVVLGGVLWRTLAECRRALRDALFRIPTGRVRKHRRSHCGG